MNMIPAHRLRDSGFPAGLKWGVPALIFALCLAPLPTASQTQPPPPESKEIQAALKIADLNARIKELERIKAVYPESRLIASIERNILAARVDLCETVDEVDAIQRPFLSQGAGLARLDNFYYACDRILRHKNLGRFDKARVTALIESYYEDYVKASTDPSVLKDVPEDQRRHIASYTGSMSLFLVQAYLGEARADKILEILERYQKTGAPLDAGFFFYRAEAEALQGKDAEAYEDFFTAAVDNYRDSEAKARALYRKLRGTEEGFDASLEAKWRGLPFHPEPFVAPADWSGKAVLAELFTGSECPPCVAADLGFDGLLEAFAPKHLVVLEYHLPIPGPDPLMNPASKARQDYYGVGSTPTPFFDGERKFPGGGSRPRAEAKFMEYRGEIERRVSETPPVALKIDAVRNGGEVKVSCAFDKELPGADAHIVLVEKEARYRGSNGIVFHKMVVRGLLAVDPTAKPSTAVFDLAKIEQAAIKHLEDYEKERAFQFKEKKAAVDPSRLAVVAFVQDRASKKVWNAAFAEVK
jgi:thiol-disulfide isomerase/thioredoxin